VLKIVVWEAGSSTYQESRVRKFLLVAALAILAWIFVVPSCSTKFGCAAAVGASAHAGNGDCPDSLQEAAQDSVWAADRLLSVAGEDITTGLLYDEDGHEEKITSGRGGSAYDLALSYLKPYAGSVLRDKPPGSQVAEHVEAKAAAIMRDTGQTYGVLVINNPDGPCGYASGIGCTAAIELILPKGSTMVVWWPRGHQSYPGKAES
jgi:SCP1.201-like deaminase